MVQRGLYTYDFPTLPPVLTSMGKDALSELRHLLSIGRERLPDLAERDPDAALAYLERASSALLLIRGLPAVVDRMAKRHGLPISQPDSAHGTEPSGDGAAKTGIRAMPPLPVRALLRPIGPGPDDDLDVALHAITTEVERQWTDTRRRFSTAIGFGE